MKLLDRISSLFLIGLSVFVLAGSYKLGTGTLRNLGSGFMPFVASALLFILSLIILLGAGRKREKKNGISSAWWKNFIKPAFLIIALLVYMILLNHLGYILTAFLLMAQMFFISEPKKWYKNTFYAAIIAILSFSLFRWLQVQLPTGIFHIGW
jgi:putative tricarboxylic transport membrane protein